MVDPSLISLLVADGKGCMQGSMLLAALPQLICTTRVGTHNLHVFDCVGRMTTSAERPIFADDSHVLL